MSFKMTVAGYSCGIHIRSGRRYHGDDFVRPERPMCSCPRCGKEKHVGYVGGTPYNPRWFCEGCFIEFDKHSTFELLPNGALFRVGNIENGLEVKMSHEKRHTDTSRR